jgi:predicted Zn-dependent protease
MDKLPDTTRAGTLYGATLAALKLRDFPLAQATLTRLVAATAANAPAARLTRLLAIDLALLQGQRTVATELARGLSDASRSTLFAHAQIDTLSGRAETAAQSLQTWLADHPLDATAWQLLAAAHNASGRTVAAVRAEAEVNVAQLDYGTALTRFKAAQELARKSTHPADHIEASIVDVRARQMESLLREQAVER